MKDHHTRRLELLLSIHLSNLERMSQADCCYQGIKQRVEDLQSQYKAKHGYEFVYRKPEESSS